MTPLTSHDAADVHVVQSRLRFENQFGQKRVSVWVHCLRSRIGVRGLKPWGQGGSNPGDWDVRMWGWGRTPNSNARVGVALSLPFLLCLNG